MKENTLQNNKKKPSFIGIDIGGTFTDAVLFTDGELKVMKTSTRPHDPASGVLELVRLLDKGDFILTHGSTLATNAVLERKGERTAFFTTSGFRDMLSIGRQDRKELYNLDQDVPKPLIPRDLCYGINERIDHMGDILTPINMEQVKEILVELMEKKVRSLSICLLFSYINPDHERDIQAVSGGLPLFVSISSDVLPQYREYERASTTTLNAYVSPILNRYIISLGSQLRGMGCIDFRIMESNGGILPAESASSLGVRTILSGPAGGVAGAFNVARNAGYSNIITLDMGGTSTDVSLCEGEIAETYESEIGGFPIALPAVDIITIGAGSGSIARIDPGGILKVGPESAGADPGPAAYGKGDLPTVTDAHLVLGTISPCDFLGGDFHVDRERSVEAISKLAEKLDITIEQCSAGIVRVAVSHMERALRVVSLERGRDPALFTLVPFGGAGPLHAPFMAEELGIKRILIPEYPGVLSAMGMLMCDFVMDFSRSVLQLADRISDMEYRDITGELYEKASAYLNTGNFSSVIFEHDYDLRYRGQSFEIKIPGMSVECPVEFGEFSLPDFPPFDPGNIVEKFHRQHKRRYGFQREEESVEIVNFRIKMTGIMEKPALESHPLCDESPDEAFIEEREITTLDGEKITIPTYSRSKLKPGNKIKSPALVVQYDTTILIPEPWNGRVDEFGNIVLE